VKIGNTLFWLGAVGTATLLIGAFALSAGSKHTDRQTQQAIDSWIEDMLAASLSEKLSLPASDIRSVFSGSGSSEATLKIEDFIHSIRLFFSQQSPASAKLLLRAQYRDGTSFSASVQRNWDDLPSDIRAAFLKTNQQEISVPWELPSENNSYLGA